MSSPAWRTASRECANRRASPISDQITTEVNAPMPYSAAKRLDLGIQRLDHRQGDGDGLAGGRAQRLDPGQPVAVPAQQITLGRGAQVIQGGVHALLPAGALIGQVLVQPDLDPGLQDHLRWDPALR